MNKVIYVAGPYRGANNWEIYNNIFRAEEVAAKLWQMGHTSPHKVGVICPHTNTKWFQGLLPDDTWLEGDLAILERCDAVYMVKGWEKSEGARAEKNFAEKHGIAVFDSFGDVEIWLRD